MADGAPSGRTTTRLEPGSQALDTGILAAVDTVDTTAQQEKDGRDYVSALYAFVKCAFVFEINNEAAFNASDRIASAANRIRVWADGVAALEMRPDGVYVNHTLVKLESGSYETGEYVSAVFAILGVGEIAAIAETVAADWLMFMAEFKRCVGPGGRLDELLTVSVQGIRVAPVKAIGAGSAGLGVTDRFRAVRAYATTVVTISEIIEHARAGRKVRPATIKRPLQDLISAAHHARPLLLALAHIKRHKVGVHHHLVNSAVIAVCTAVRLAVPRSVLCELAMQAVLHDVGRAFVVGQVRVDGPGAERRYALETVRKLVQSGAVSLRSIGRVVVANEARRWSAGEPGEGDDPYPFDVSAAGKLVAVAHAYSLLTTATPERPALLPDEALRVLLAEAGRRYDTTAVRLVANTLGVYPVGSVVALTDGRAAVVVEAPHDAAGATRPRVKVVRDLDGAPIDGEIIDLAGDAGADVRIVSCIDGDDAAINAPAFLLS